MTDKTANAGRLLTGFTGATIVLGAALILLWIVFWAMAALGGPQMQMPARLLGSGATLLVLGYLLRMLFTARAAKSAE